MDMYWVATLTLALMTVIRACNVGFHKETYIISAFAYIPMIYRIYYTGTVDMIALYIFYLCVSVFGFYKWKLKEDTEKRKIKIKINKKNEN